MRFFASLVLSLNLLLAPTSTTWAGDDNQFTLVVNRHFNKLLARAVNQRIYVNDRFVGEVGNGTRIRFSVPTNNSGSYSMRVNTMTSITAGMTADFMAKPGEEVVAQIGCDFAWVDGNTIYGIKEYTLRPGTLKVIPPQKGVTLTLNGRQFSVLTPQSVSTNTRTTTNRCLRIAVAAKSNSQASNERFLLFVQPEKVCWLDFTSVRERGGDSVVADTQFFAQSRACVLHHLAGDFQDLTPAINELIEDLRALRTTGVSSYAMSYREAQIEYLKKVEHGIATSTMSRAAKNLAYAALWCGAEAMLTGTAPTGSDILESSISAMFKTAFSEYEANKEVTEASDEFKIVEDEFANGLRSRIVAVPALKANPMIRQVFFGEFVPTTESELVNEAGALGNQGIHLQQIEPTQTAAEAVQTTAGRMDKSEKLSTESPHAQNDRRQSPNNSADSQIRVHENSSAIEARLLIKPGRVTAVSKDHQLFEAQFEFALENAKGERLFAYRNAENPRALGFCHVVGFKDRKIVAEGDGFVPQIGDWIMSPHASH